MTKKLSTNSFTVTASQDALTARIRFFGRVPSKTKLLGAHVTGKVGSKRANPSQWREPPHEGLANVPTYDTGKIPQALTTRPVRGITDPKAMDAFVKRYGTLSARINKRTRSFDENAVDFASFQEILRGAWTGDKAALGKILGQAKDALEPKVSVRAEEIVIDTENLWSFICLLFLRDYRADKTKLCARPDCKHPYFVEKHKRQKYCSQQCAVLMNVRNFRQRKKFPSGRQAMTTSGSPESAYIPGKERMNGEG